MECKVLPDIYDMYSRIPVYPDMIGRKELVGRRLNMQFPPDMPICEEDRGREVAYAYPTAKERPRGKMNDTFRIAHGRSLL